MSQVRSAISGSFFYLEGLYESGKYRRHHMHHNHRSTRYDEPGSKRTGKTGKVVGRVTGDW